MEHPRPIKTIPLFLVVVFLFLVLGILATGFYFYSAQQQRILADAENNLSSIADLKIQQITRWRQEHLDNARMIQSNRPLVRLVESYGTNPHNSSQRQDLLSEMQSFQRIDGYESVVLVNRSGIALLSSSPYGDSIGTYAQVLLKNVSATHSITLSDLHRSGPVQFVHLDLFIPLFSIQRKDSTLIGTFLIRINPHMDLYPLIQSWPTQSRTAETLILEQDQDSVVYLNELRHRKNTTLSMRLPISRKDLPGSMAVRGIQGIIEGVDYRGAQVIATIRKIQFSPWFMEAKIDKEEILEPLKSEVWIVGISAFFLIVSALSMVALVWRNQQVKFYRESYLAEVERQAIQKHYDYIIKYANDGILLINMDGRIIEANDQACRIYGYSRDEFCKLYVQDIRSPKLRHLINGQMKQTEHQGGLLFETEHIRKDGAAFPVEVSSRFISIDNQKYYQSIVRDITARKQSELSIKHSVSLLQATMNATTDGLLVIDTSEKITGYNNQFRKIWGIPEEVFDQGVSQKLLDYTLNKIKDPEGFVQRARKLMNEPETVSVDIVEFKDGRIYERHSHPQKIEGRTVGRVWSFRDITQREHAEMALQDINNTLHTIIDAAPLPIFELDLDGRVQNVWNPAAEKLLGWTREEILGKPLPSVTVDKAEEFRKFRELIHSGKFMNGIPVVRRKKDGSPIEYAIYASPLHDQNGNITGNIVLLVDLTERRQAEQAIQQSESLFKTLVETSPVAIAVFSGVEKKVKYLSKQFTELFGYNPNDVPSMDAWWPLAYPVPEYCKQIQTKWFEIVAKGIHEETNIEPLESVITCQDGSTKYIESTFISINEEIFVFFIDLTQHRLAEEALRQTHSFNDLLIQTMPFGIDIVDEDGKILFMSKIMRDMLGVDATDSCCWLSYKDNQERCPECPLHKGIMFGKPETIEVAGIFGGKTYQVSHVGMLYEGKKAMLEVFQDITEQKRLQQELVQSQKLLSIGTMAGGIAHDFNNILAIILGYSSILHSIKDVPQKFSDGVSAIKQAVDRGAGLVRQILTFARKTDTSFESFDISDLVKEIISMLQQTFPKIITFKTTIPKYVPHIYADHTQMHQAILNLCVNARDAMPQGGEISLTISEVSGIKLKERFSSASQDSYIRVDVSDTGMGMDESTRNQIFDPFFTTKEKGKGTGLGLSVVYGIMHAHQGFIDVESTVGRGTTFHLYLPIPRESGDTVSRQIQEESQIAGGNETILFVEDEALLVEMVQILLESNGYTVLTAKDGEEAVEAYRNHMQEIGLVISDMGLPKLTGMAEFEKLKEINPRVKIIFASGFFEPDIKATLENAGAKGFLQKPYVIEEMLSKIRKTLDSK